MVRLTYIALLLCVICVGCEKLFSYSGAVTGGDLAALDLAASDAAADSQPDTDLPTTDAPQKDALAPGDSVLDSFFDAESTDTLITTDASVIPSDAVISSPCAQGSLIPWLSSMVICELADPITQCQAAPLCAAGWHLCTASEYQLRAVVPPPGEQNYWLASCIREGDTRFAPSDSICAGDCVMDLGESLAMGWGCGSNPVTISYFPTTPVAVATFPDCYRLGLDDSSTENYWRPNNVVVNSNQNAYGAVCCQ